MKIVLYNKDTIMINIICILADIVSICLTDINLIASILLFVFSIIFNLVTIWKLYKKNNRIQLSNRNKRIFMS